LTLFWPFIKRELDTLPTADGLYSLKWTTKEQMGQDTDSTHTAGFNSRRGLTCSKES
jgi:hypothetical protein